jgi:hypothetical protein
VNRQQVEGYECYYGQAGSMYKIRQRGLRPASAVRFRECCDDPADWLRREIETALANRHNIVPLMLEGFDFANPKIARQLTGTLAALKNYNGLKIPPEYFGEENGTFTKPVFKRPISFSAAPQRTTCF